MSYLASHTLALDAEFLARLAAALTKAAANVLKEDPLTPEHLKRVDLAVRVFNAPTAYANRISIGVATEFDGVTPDDAALGALIGAYWTTFATGPQVTV